MPLISLLFAALTLLAPSPNSTEDDETQLLPLYEGTEEDAMSLNEASDRVTQLREQPLDINKVTANELLSIPGIDLATANSIIYYRRKYGDFRSVQELDMIEDIDEKVSRYLSTMLCVESSDTIPWYNPRRLRKALAQAEHTVMFTMAVPTYYRLGDKGSVSASVTSSKQAGVYLGDPLKHSLRYTMNVGNNLQFNFAGAKAAGEPFFSSGNNMGYDRYSYSLVAKNIGIVRYAILGQFRGQFGMGLVFNNSLSFGKQSMLTSIGRRTTYFAPHTSTSDSRHMQGVAMTFDVIGGTLSALFSYRYVDATLAGDSVSVQTVLTSATHRTAKDMAKKNNTTQMAAGLRMEYSGMFHNEWEWSVGTSFLYTGFNRELNPIYSRADTLSRSKMYRLYYPQGSHFWNGGIDYKLHAGALTIIGETAVSENGSVATLDNIIYNASRRLSLTAAGRIYPYRYHALYGSAFGDSHSVSNERGVLLGAHLLPTNSLTIDIYSDLIRFPWLRYRVYAPSSAWDNAIAVTMSRSRWTYGMRYRLKKQWQDEDATTHRLRLNAQYAGRKLSTRTALEAILTTDNSNGYVVNQSLTWQLHRRYSVYGTVSYFDPDDYASRIYVYERGMLYSMNSASYYGNGMRYALHVRGEVTPWLLAQLKVGCTKYFDRTVIGTADRRIFSSSQTDIDLQVRVRF